MKEVSLYKKRMFLNPDKSSNAFVNASVDRLEDVTQGKDGKPVLDGTVTIADCDRQISLDIDGWSKKHRKNTVKKLDNLIDVLVAVRNVVEENEFEEV